VGAGLLLNFKLDSIKNPLQKTSILGSEYKVGSHQMGICVHGWNDMVCLVTLCQYFNILFPKPFPVRNIIWTWVWLSMVIGIWVFEMQHVWAGASAPVALQLAKSADGLCS